MNLGFNTLVAVSLEDLAAGRQTLPELVMAPSQRQAIEQVSASGDVLWVKALEDVSGRQRDRRDADVLREGTVELARRGNVAVIKLSGFNQGTSRNLARALDLESHELPPVACDASLGNV